MICVNFCEILTRAHLEKGIATDIIRRIEIKHGGAKISRIYVGSSFCSQYLKKMNFWDLLIQLCEENDLHITLCIPIISERDLGPVKDMLRTWIVSTDRIDEITVNDLGMLQFISQTFPCKINLGRLFVKDARDVRVKEYYDSCIHPSILSYDLTSMGISGIEFDPMSRQMNLESNNLDRITVCLHSPYCYMTTGNICKYASVHKSPEQKFRPNINCAFECSSVCETYHAEKNDYSFDIIRVGRGVYFYNPDPIVSGRVDRILYFPIEEILGRST